MLDFLPDTRGIIFSVRILACSNAQMRDQCSPSGDIFYSISRSGGRGPCLKLYWGSDDYTRSSLAL